MACDICGKKGEIYRAIVEDVELEVCNDCSSYGKIVGKESHKAVAASYGTIRNKNEQLELITDNYFEIIKKSRERLQLTQKDFAKRLNEKESLIHKIETGSVKPSIHLARKLEKFLKVKLIVDYEEDHDKRNKHSNTTLTIGDILSLKR